MDNKLTIEQRVANGAAFLNENVPNWFQEISTETLDVNDFEKCVLGQIFGHYDTAKDTMRNAFIHSSFTRAEMGFDLIGDDGDKMRIDGEKLTAEWKKIVDQYWWDH